MTLGVFSSSYYVEGAKQSAEFLKAFEAKYSVIPSVYSAGAYATAQMLDAALKTAKTKVTGEDLIKAIKDADLKGNVSVTSASTTTTTSSGQSSSAKSKSATTANCGTSTRRPTTRSASSGRSTRRNS